MEKANVRSMPLTLAIIHLVLLALYVIFTRSPALRKQEK